MARFQIAGGEAGIGRTRRSGEGIVASVVDALALVHALSPNVVTIRAAAELVLRRALNMTIGSQTTGILCCVLLFDEAQFESPLRAVLHKECRAATRSSAGIAFGGRRVRAWRAPHLPQ